jgi:DNA polymerase-1
MGVEPSLIPDLKALMGDPSDNYPGIPGVGPKTASHLINQYGTLEEIYIHIDKIENPKIKNLLNVYQKDAFLFKKVATILKEVEIPFNLGACEFKGYNENLKKFFEQYETFSLIKRYFPQTKNEPKKIDSPKKTAQLDLFG